tara:strand:- start:170 stop:544 length:375 start_codon:yes stop_codon:yes gene_type:complete
MKPFDFINSITYKKNIAMDSTNESSYNPFITNRALSQFVDCILLSNEMNMRHHIDNKLQYDYYINRIRPKNRFKKWDKKQDNESIELIKQYYGYNNDKASSALSILSEQQLDIIRKKLNKGGVK